MAEADVFSGRGERRPRNRPGSRRAAGPSNLQRVELTEGVFGHLALPSEAGPASAVVVMPAIAGINDYVLGVARELSQSGHIALVVDTFSREGRAPDVSDPARIAAAVAAMPDPRAAGDALAAARYLQTHSRVAADAIGILGFCIGGTHALLAACDASPFRAAVNFYGLMHYAETSANKPASPIDRVPTLGCPLLNHNGDADRLISRSDILAFGAELDRAGKLHESFIYSGAPHAFHEHHRPQVYRPVAAYEAWQRTLRFLGWYLRPDAQPIQA